MYRPLPGMLNHNQNRLCTGDWDLSLRLKLLIPLELVVYRTFVTVSSVIVLMCYSRLLLKHLLSGYSFLEFFFSHCRATKANELRKAVLWTKGEHLNMEKGLDSTEPFICLCGANAFAVFQHSSSYFHYYYYFLPCSL